MHLSTIARPLSLHIFFTSIQRVRIQKTAQQLKILVSKDPDAGLLLPAFSLLSHSSSHLTGHFHLVSIFHGDGNRTTYVNAMQSYTIMLY